MKHREQIRERLVREGRTNLGWYEDHEMCSVMLELFGHYQHVWLKKTPTSKILKALCTGFEHRGGLPNETGRPMCPGCARRKKGDWT